jgi:hypothetical protein
LKLTKRLSISKIDLDKISLPSRASPPKKMKNNHNNDISPSKDSIPRLKLKFNVKKLTQIDEIVAKKSPEE